MNVPLDPEPDPYLTIESPQTVREVQQLLGWMFEDMLTEPDGHPAYAADYGTMPYPLKESQDVMARSGMLPMLVLWPTSGAPTSSRSSASPPPAYSRGFAWTAAEVERRIETGAWKGPARTRKYRPKDGAGAWRNRCWCPAQCYARHEATRLDDLDWHTRVTLTAPDWEAFGRWWGRMQILAKLDGLSRRLDRQPYYLGVIALSPRKGLIHAHLVIGGGNRDVIAEILARWPGQAKILPADHPWKAIHYTLSQTIIAGIPSESKSDYWKRVKAAHHLVDGDGILQYFDSSNLELLYQLRKRQIARTDGRRATEGRSTDWKIERARKGGLAKAANRARRTWGHGQRSQATEPATEDTR